MTVVNFQVSRATIRDVAREANVSISTVSRYINQSGHVDLETAGRIQAAIDRTHYTPSIAARSLKNQKSSIVLLVVPDICNPFYSGIAQTVQRLVRKNGYVMALYDSNESQEELPAVQIAHQMYASGILLGSIDVKPEMIQALLSTKIPVVGLNAYEEYPFDTVHVHGIDGSYLAVRHLISLGHRRIAFAGGTPRSMIGASRREGYLKAMAEAGCPVMPEYVIEIGFSQSDGYCAGRYFAKLRPLPTAVCCANDQVALGLLSAMHENGISVPGQLSVTGMDNIPYAVTSNPSLTSVTNDSGAFAREGVRMLFERINGICTSKTPRDVAIPHELILRASTDIPRRET